MNEELNTVRAVVRAVDGGDAIVEIEQGGCGRCHEEGGCGGQNITQMFCASPKRYRVANEPAAQIGDQVVVAIGAGGIRRTANRAYGLPLVAVIGGALLGAAVDGDLGAMFGALVGLIGAFAYLRQRGRNALESGDLNPHIVSRP